MADTKPTDEAQQQPTDAPNLEAAAVTAPDTLPKPKGYNQLTGEFVV